MLDAHGLRTLATDLRWTGSGGAKTLADQALEGTELEVDRGTGLFMLRYTRDGITYEVRFDYVAQVDAPI